MFGYLIYCLFVMSFSIISFNCAGCATFSRHQEVRAEVLAHLSDVLFLQETNLSRVDTVLWASWPFKGFHSLLPTSRGGGLYIGLGPHCLSYFPEAKVSHSVPGYLLHLELQGELFTLHLFNIYVPGDATTGTSVVTSLASFLSDIPPSDAVILGGDFNLTLEPALDRLSGSEHRPGLVRLLSTTLGDSDLVDVFRSIYPAQRDFTWAPRGAAAGFPTRLDRFYASSFLRSGFSQISHLPSLSSDHSFVFFSLFLRFSTFRVSKWAFNPDFLCVAGFSSVLFSFFSSWVPPPQDSSSSGMNWLSFKASLRAAVMAFCHADIVRSGIRQAEIRAQFLPTMSSEDHLSWLSRLRPYLRASARRAAYRYLQSKAHFMDHPFELMARLEQRKRRSQSIFRLRRPDGSMVTGRQRLCDYVSSFYGSLFSPSSATSSFPPALFTGLPALSRSQRDLLDRPFGAAEVCAAISSLSNGKVPGPDGLPVEFYKAHAPSLVSLLLSAFLSIPSDSSWLPPFLTTQVTLLPKRGDLQDLRNWRPIGLTNCDYKILAKMLTLRLSLVISSLVHPTQTFSIPGRTLASNLHIIRNLIFLAEARMEQLALLNLDQVKAYDRVSHAFLWTVLSAFSFGPVFSAYVRSLYQGATVRVSGGSFLTADFPLRRGVRQGCPLSGLLFVLAVEPFLHLLRNTILEHRLSVEPTLNPSFTVTSVTFADDITLVFRSEEEFDLARFCYSLYAQASDAALNLAKCHGLWCGAWRESPPSSPWVSDWSTEGMVFLGVPFGTRAYLRSSLWPPLLARITTSVSFWLPLRSGMSIRQRAALCNVAITSVLWHVCQFYTPPRGVIATVVQQLRRLLWSGARWVAYPKLRYPLCAGGVLLDNISSRVTSFRLAFVASLLQSPESLLFQLTDEIFCRRPGIFNFVTSIRMSLSHYAVGHVGTFYAECAVLWRRHGGITVLSEDPLREPLFLSPHFRFPFAAGPILDPPEWVCFRVTAVRDLLDSNGHWISLPSVFPSLCVTSHNIALFRFFRSFLIRRLPSLFSSTGFLLPLPPPSPTSLTQHMVLDGTPYLLSMLRPRFWYVRFLRSSPVLATTVSQVSSSDTLPWDYCRPVLSRGLEADVQWRMLHGALPTPRRRFLMQFSSSDLCSYCSVTGDVMHTYLDCSILVPVLRMVRFFARGFCGVLHSPQEYFSLLPDPLCPLSFSPFTSHLTCRYLFVLFKWVIYRFYLSSPPFSPSLSSYVLYRSFLSECLSRINVEFFDARRRDRLQEFYRVWDPGGGILDFGPDGVTWLSPPPLV